MLVGLLLGVVLAEGGLRLAGLDPMGHILADPRSSQWNAECFELDADLGYRYAPEECGTNALGFPDQALSSDGRPRVLLLGDSISADRMYGQFLEQLLTAQQGRPVEVINTGTPGYSTRNEYALYQRHAAALDPDVVLVQFCLNDYEGTPFLFRHNGQIMRVRDAKNEMWGRSSFWFSRSALYRYLTLHSESLSESQADYSEHFPNTESALAGLHDAVGEKLVVVVFPLVDAPERWGHKETIAYHRILKVLGESGIRHIDLTEPFMRGGGERLQRRFGPDLYADLSSSAQQWASCVR